MLEGGGEGSLRHGAKGVYICSVIWTKVFYDSIRGIFLFIISVCPLTLALLILAHVYVDCCFPLFRKQSDPIAVVYMKRRDGTLEEIGRTEVIMNNLNPSWITEIPVTYQFEIVQPLV